MSAARSKPPWAWSRSTSRTAKPRSLANDNRRRPLLRAGSVHFANAQSHRSSKSRRQRYRVLTFPWRMNSFEKWCCGSALWRYLTRGQLLPWMLRHSHLGDHLLEVGAGPGAATIELAHRAPRVTSLEYDHALALKLRRRVNLSSVTVIQGDAAALPFPDGTFSSVISILMLHHLKSIELQDRTFAEVRRVLRPGGIFLAFDIPDGWIHRVSHIKSTFVPMDPSTAPQRLLGAGLSHVRMESRSGAFLLRAVLPE